EVTIDGEVKQVEGIKENSFENLKINSVTFPKTDVEFIIKDSAFQNSGITKVTFEEGLKSVESRAFKDNKLTEVSIPSTVWKTGSESFMNNEISKLEISDDVDSIQIDNFSFANNKLQLVKLPYSIFKIRHFVFQDNTGYENSKVVRLETRNPEHLQASTYIIPESDHHKIVLVTDVDRSELFQELQSVKSIVKSDYKQEQIDEFDKVLQEAKRIFKDEKSTQEQVDKAFDDLVKAEAKLRQSAPDRSKLRDSIKRAEALIPEAFEKESYDAMKKELDKAKEVLADLDKTSDEITAANKSLEEALSNLVIKKDYLYTSEDFTYEGNAITGFSESGKAKFKVNKDLVLPDKTPEGKDIEVIGKSAFSLEKDPGVNFGTDTVSSANGMVSVKLPQNLKRIEEDAFRLNNFKNVEFPSTLEYIGGSAFNGNRLEKVILPDSVKDVEGGAFSLNQITELRLSPNMTKVANGTFARNIKLKKLEIPEGIKVIEGSAFQGAPLKELNISKTVEEIKGRAFTGHQLEELTIPGNVKKIGRQAFAHNIKWKRLKKLTLGEGIEEIGDSAFRHSLLLETNLPKSLKKLSNTAFRDAVTTDKKHVIVKLYTENPDHLKFNNEKSLVNQKVIFKGEVKPGTIEEIPEIKAEDIEKEVVKQGEKIDVTDNIKNLPEKATVTDVTEPKIDTNKPGEYTAKVELTFANGSKRIVEIPVVVEKKDEVTPVDPVDPTDPTEPTIPTDPTKPVEPETPQSKDINDTDTLKEIFEKIPSTRIAGRNRQLTAVEVSKTLFEKADTVIITSSDKMVDSLAASPKGIAINAPTLFVEKDSIMDEVLQEIKRLNPSKIIIAGGEESISDDVEKQLQQLGIKQQRVAGADRFETAVKLGEEIRRNSSNKTDVILVNGYNSIDALTAGSLAAKLNIPILLTGSDQLNKTTEKALKNWNIQNVIIVGGTTQVSETIASQLKGDGIMTSRLEGRTRVETALEVAKAVNSDPDKVIFANKDAFADALLAPYLSNAEKAPIVLIDKDEASVSVKQYLRDNEIKNGIILGGEKSIEEYK
ncbi:MAG: leucine-rich repeat protein, partial [Finegoldia magna]|nr:leucine-rich repeat protein [Finegoldia magna]